MNPRYLIASALAAAVVAPVVLSAQKPVPPPTAFKTEKCYGIAKAGKNDCASTGNNSCGGSSKASSDPKAWIYVPAGYCERIVGGSLRPKERRRRGNLALTSDARLHLAERTGNGLRLPHITEG